MVGDGGFPPPTIAQNLPKCQAKAEADKMSAGDFSDEMVAHFKP